MSKFLRDLSVRGKIALLMAWGLLTVAAVGGYDWWAIDQLEQQMENLGENRIPAQMSVAELQETQTIVRAEALEILSFEEASDFSVRLQTVLAGRQENWKRLEESWKNWKAVPRQSEKGKSLQAELEQHIELWRAAYRPLDSLMELLRQTPGSAERVPLMAKYRAQYAKIVPIALAMDETLDEAADNNGANTIRMAEEGDQLAMRVEKRALAMMLLGAALLLFMGWRISRLLIEPVAEVTAMAKRMSQGDFTVRTKNDSKDELGQMARALSETCGTLRQMISGIQQNAQMLASASEETAAISKQFTSSSEEMNRQAAGIASATRSMSENFASVDRAVGDASRHGETVSATATGLSSGMSSASAALEQVRGGTRDVANASRELASTIQEIARSAAQANSTSQQAVEAVGKASSEVDALAQASQEIEQIIEVIVAIAGQTKLLALNATIEASRAGEVGRGFSVVANEVKELARQTNEATEGIRARVQGMQQSTGTTIASIGAIRGVISEVSDSVGRIAAAVEEQNVTMRSNSESVDQMANGVDQVVAQVNETARGAAQIAQDIQGISRSIGEVSREVTASAQGAEEVGVTIGEVSQAIGEASGGAHQLNTAAEDLSRMAQELNAMVAHFQV